MNERKRLTTKIFKRKSCPKWARYAVVNKSGAAYYYECEPTVDERLFVWKGWRGYVKYCGEFDATDWKHSLIKRPEVKK